MADLLSYLAEPFFQRALLAGCLASLLAGALGVFVVARGASFFGDAIAHGALSGVALGLLLDTHPLLTALLVALGLAMLLHAVSRTGAIKLDTALGLVFSLGMALGVVLLSFREGYQPELLGFLFGNVLAVSWTDVATMAALATAVAAALWRSRARLLFVTFDPVAAHASGVPVGRVELLFQVLLTLTVVAGIRLLGVVLVNALLVLPAATALLLGRSLRATFVLAPALGLGATVAGLALSAALDLPSGPAVVLVASAVFLVTLVAARPRRRVA